MIMETIELKKTYRRVFSVDGGDIVLADILNLCGYFNNTPETMDPKLMALANTILTRLNVIDTTDVKGYVERMLMTAPPIGNRRQEVDPYSYNEKEE